MREYISEALVLVKDPAGEADCRVSVFAKDFGKLVGRAKSARKITSKLGPHLEPGNFVQVRFIEKNNLQITDVLKKSRFEISPTDLYFLDRVLAEGEVEPKIWEMINGGRFDWRAALAVLGWDPEEASCENCPEKKADYFHIKSHAFFCAACASAAPKNDLICLDNRNG